MKNIDDSLELLEIVEQRKMPVLWESDRVILD